MDSCELTVTSCHVTDEVSLAHLQDNHNKTRNWNSTTKANQPPWYHPTWLDPQILQLFPEAVSSGCCWPYGMLSCPKCSIFKIQPSIGASLLTFLGPGVDQQSSGPHASIKGVSPCSSRMFLIESRGFRGVFLWREVAKTLLKTVPGTPCRKLPA